MIGRLFFRSICGTVLALAVAGCAGGQDNADRPAGQRASHTAPAESLAGVCPATIVVQDNWWPQAETGSLYGLLGEDLRIDTGKKRVSGSLVSAGGDTGVRIEIRAGGPANGFTPAAKIVYLDKEVLLGAADIDQAISVSDSGQPVLSVFATMDVSPLVLMWDPQAHPNWRTIADIGKTDTRVLYFPGSTYMEYLVNAAILRKSQVEGSYDGTPARFIAERGRIVQQGYLTNEVYQYQNELPQWKKRVAWRLVNDTGYPNYPETLAIRPDRRAELTPCLRKLVPILQRSAVNYAANPTATNNLLVRLVKEYNAFPYSPARAAAAAAEMKRHGILGNGGNRAIGDFDTARVQKLIGIVGPIFGDAGKPIKSGLRAGDVATNEFIDPTIGLP